MPLIAGLALLVGLAVAGPAMAQGGVGAATVEVRVWQSVDDDRDLYVSARPSGGSWRTLGTLPLALDGLTTSEGYRYGDVALAVPQGDGEAEVELRVWQDASSLRGIYVSVRFAGGSWSVPGTAALPLDDGFASNGRYRYGDVSLAVPPEDAASPEPTASLSEIVLPSVTIEFKGDFLGAERALTQELERHFNDVAAFFVQRYGLAVPDLTIIREGPLALGVNRAFIAHDYVHALQHQISAGNFGPEWMDEGMAAYFEEKLDEVYEERIVSTLEVATWSQDSLRDMEIIKYKGFNHPVASLAIHQLVLFAGEESLFEFYATLKNSASWQEEFEESFGIAVDEFYDKFASYRAESAPSLPQIRGIVLDPDGEPVPNVWISAYPLMLNAGIGDITGMYGRFTIAVRSGRYVLEVRHSDCGPAGFLDDAGLLTRSREDARIFEIGSSNVTGIVVDLPADPAQLCAHSGSGWELPVDVEEPELLPGVSVAFLAGLPGASAGRQRLADGPAESALFNRPMGMALTASGDVIVADFWNHAIRRIAPDGMVTTVAGGNGQGVRDGPAAVAQFAGPSDVAVHADGSIYVSDSRGNRIRRIGMDGMVTTVAGGGPIGRENAEFRDGPAAEARFTEPFAITFDHDGNLLIVDRSHRRIRALSPAGRVSTIADLAGIVDDNGPSGIAVAADGTIFFAGGSVGRIDGRGNVSTVLQNIQGGPSGGITVGPDGALYVVARPRHTSPTSDAPQLFRVARDGSTLSAIDVDGAYELAGIVRTDDGALLVSDAGSNAIWRITFDGE